MLKQTITFVDFNGVEKTKDLYFHVSKANVLTAPDDAYNEILLIGSNLQEQGKRLEAIESEFDAQDPFNPKTRLVTDSARMIGRLLDRLVDLSYGERSADGSRFIKTQEVLENFKQSAAYEAFIDKMIMNQPDMLKFIERLLEK